MNTIDAVSTMSKGLAEKSPETKKLFQYLPNYCRYKLDKPSQKVQGQVVLPMIDAAVQEGIKARAMIKRVEPKAVNLYKTKVAPDHIIQKAERIVMDFNPGIEYETPEFEKLVEREIKLLMSGAKK